MSTTLLASSSPAAAVALSTRGLVKRYGGRVVVDHVDLDLYRGEVFGLLGPNGAGKTTLMHLLAGAVARDAGTVAVFGSGDPRVADTRRRIGLAPQSPSLYAELSAEENLRFFGRIQGVSGKKLDDAVGVALELASLQERRDDRVATFSGGMQRRLNLACATIHDPAVLLLDEPTAGVDPQSRSHLFECIGNLARSGRTVVVSTHHTDEAERLCDRVAILDRGRVRAVGEVARLRQDHGGGASLERALLALTGETPRDA